MRFCGVALAIDRSEGKVISCFTDGKKCKLEKQHYRINSRFSMTVVYKLIHSKSKSKMLLMQPLSLTLLIKTMMILNLIFK